MDKMKWLYRKMKKLIAYILSNIYAKLDFYHSLCRVIGAVFLNDYIKEILKLFRGS